MEEELPTTVKTRFRKRGGKNWRAGRRSSHSQIRFRAFGTLRAARLVIEQQESGNRYGDHSPAKTAAGGAAIRASTVRVWLFLAGRAADHPVRLAGAASDGSPASLVEGRCGSPAG